MNELLRRILFLPRQASSMASEIDQLHYAVILTTMAGATLVAGAAAYFMIRYRRRSAAEGGHDFTPAPAPRTQAGRFEAVAAAALLLLFVAFWAAGFKQFVKLETPPADAIEVYVVAKQWMWTFGYPNGRGSKAVLYVPANRPVKLSMTSRDVIHSFFVPEFRVKKDVVPGRTTEIWFEANAPGTYAVFCTEYCGEGHSTMRASVVALSDADYARALEGLPVLDIAGPVYAEPSLPTQLPRQELSLAAMGERVAAERGCMRCHTPDGTPHIGPSWVGMYGATVPLEGGGEVLADAAYLTESMMDPLARVHRGFPPVMPSYRGLLTAPEAGALLEYFRAVSERPLDARGTPLVSADAPPVRLPTVVEPAPRASEELP